MTRFNLFEGSRRIALLLKVVWVIGVGVVAYNQSPYVSLTFFTMMPNDPFVRLPNEECNTGADDFDYVSREFDEGKTVSVQLCYKVARSDSGQFLIPFRVEPGGRWWGNEKYSSDVLTYTAARSSGFNLGPDDRDAASRLWNQQWWKNLRNAILFGVGGWLVLSVLQALVGWIVRGFLGIPWGQDRRPEPLPSAVEVP